MVYFTIFICELFLLFALSKKLTNLLFNFFHRITKSIKLSTYFLSILFLPGTLIHELSHALMATLLFTHVGKMDLIPKLAGNNLKLGSVEIGKTDPIRRLFIGMGPFLFGTMIIICIFYLGAFYQLFTNQIFIIAAGYAVFEIGNTMFSSNKDMEGALEVVIAILVITLILYLIGVRFPAFNPDLVTQNTLFQEIFQKASLYLAIPISIDLIIIIFLKSIK
jgi:hypothetical protein